MPHFLSLLLCLAFLLPVGPARADSGADAVVHAGRLLDVARGEYRANVLIVIRDGRIIELVEADDETAPEATIDLRNHTVLPGLIDTHTHLCDNAYMGDDFDYWSLPAAAFGIAGVVNARKVLEAGFTTVRNVSDPFYAGLALRDAIEKGWVEGPRMYVSGPMITMTGGHGDWGSWMAPEHGDDTPAEAVADGPDEVRKQARVHLKYGVDWLKLSATGGFSSHGTIPGAVSYSLPELRVAVEEAAKQGRFVAAHAHGEQGILNAIQAGVRSIEHAGLMEDRSMAAMRDQEVFLVMDLLAAHYDLIETGKTYDDKQLSTDGESFYSDYAERFRRAHGAGLRMAFGTDSGVYPHGRNAEQFSLMVDAGMTPIDAIRSATTTAADLLGISGQAGTVEPGSWADLIAVDGDPLADVAALTKVSFVMKEGRVIRAVP